VIIFWLFFGRVGRAGQAVWTFVTDRPTSRRVPWRYLFGRALRSPRIWLQLATIVAVLVVYPLSFLLAAETREPIINALMILWVVAAFVPVVEAVISRRRSPA